MDLNMLPAQSYEEAIPFLRRPYTPNLVRGLVINAPDSTTAPCTIGLYAIGESLMDRLNLTCGPDWEHDFEIVKESEYTAKGKTFYYCEVQAILVVFGVLRRDIGASSADTPGGAKMNARAQAWKRTGRWHGPGQCLYGTEDFLVFRGEEPGKLHVPKSGEHPHKRPYIDKACELVIREQYKGWLTEEGEKSYGPPLEHMEVAEAILARRQSNGSARPPRRARACARPDAAANGAPAERQVPAPAAEESPATEATQPTAPAGESFGPMPDHPAPAAALEAAKGKGFGEPVARVLSNLARADGQEEKPTDAQLQAVTNWLAALSALKTPEDVVLKAAGHKSGKPMSQERRQALFARWLARKAAGEHDTDGHDPTTNGDPTQEDSPDTSDQKDAASNGKSDLQRALAELRRKMTEHEYDDQAVTRFAALATGGGPRTQVKWAQVSPDTLLILADLLENAAAIGWSNEQLDQAVRAAHQSSRQNSTAGRFSALANHITDLAETRAMDSA